MNRSLRQFLLLLVFIRLCVGETLIFDEEEQSIYSTISCIENEPCNIICNGTGSCRNSQFICKEGYECNIECIADSGAQSPCWRTTTICPSNANCNINCTGGYESCVEANIQCPSDGNCTIGCDECRYADIACPDNGDCDIICTGSFGCAQTSIECSLFGNCNIECDSSHACYEANINCASSDNQCNIGCLSHYSCKGTTIQTSNSGDFQVTCPATEACRDMKLICPQNNKCTMECNAYYGCYNSSVDARYSSELHITGCIGTSSCADVSIWAPPNLNGNKTCYLEGDDDLNKLTIYAVNGWNDIDLSNYIGTNYARGSGVMYCNSDYSDSCYISDLSWNCINTSSICITINNQTVPTSNPTVYPTSNPTNNPTESTINPTSNPTNGPTNNLTNDLTNATTIVATNDPTNNSTTESKSEPDSKESDISPKQYSLYFITIFVAMANLFV
eukprot:491769_1